MTSPPRPGCTSGFTDLMPGRGLLLRSLKAPVPKPRSLERGSSYFPTNAMLRNTDVMPGCS